MPILILCMALSSACSTPRKACRKAERHMARAVWLCPEILHQDSVTVTLPATRDTIAAAPATPDLDSLLEACRSLNIALAAANAAKAPTEHGKTPVQPDKARGPGVKQAVAKVQQEACNWQGFTEHVGRISITVRNVGGSPVLLVDDPGEVRRVPCPPTVNKTVVTGVAEWYRTAFWALVGMVVLFCASFIATHHA